MTHVRFEEVRPNVFQRGKLLHYVCVLEETVLLKSPVFIRQAVQSTRFGLLTLHCLCFVLMSFHRASSLLFSLKSSQPHQHVLLCQTVPDECQPDRSFPCLSSVRAAINPRIAYSRTSLYSCDPSQTQHLLHIYGCCSLQEDTAMLALVWKSSGGATAPGPNHLSMTLLVNVCTYSAFSD